MKGKELLLREYAGQECDVRIIVRENGTSFINFQSKKGYGHPSLEKDEIQELLKTMENLEEI